MEAFQLVETADEVRQRFDPEQFVLADLLIEQHIADRHQSVSHDGQHLGAFEPERAARMQGDDQRPVGGLLDLVGEHPDVLYDVIRIRPHQRQIPLGLRDGGSRKADLPPLRSR